MMDLNEKIKNAYFKFFRISWKKIDKKIKFQI